LFDYSLMSTNFSFNLLCKYKGSCK